MAGSQGFERAASPHCEWLVDVSWGAADRLIAAGEKREPKNRTVEKLCKVGSNPATKTRSYDVTSRSISKPRHVSLHRTRPFGESISPYSSGAFQDRAHLGAVDCSGGASQMRSSRHRDPVARLYERS